MLDRELSDIQTADVEVRETVSTPDLTTDRPVADVCFAFPLQCPQQNNSYDCGIYIMEFALRLAAATTALTPPAPQLLDAAMDGQVLRRRFADLLVTSDDAVLPIAEYLSHPAADDNNPPLLLRSNRLSTIAHRAPHLRALAAGDHHRAAPPHIYTPPVPFATIADCEIAGESVFALASTVHALHARHRAGLLGAARRGARLAAERRQRELLGEFLALRRRVGDAEREGGEYADAMAAVEEKACVAEGLWNRGLDGGVGDAEREVVREMYAECVVLLLVMRYALGRYREVLPVWTQLRGECGL